VISAHLNEYPLQVCDAWIISRLASMSKDVTAHMNDLQMQRTTNALYAFAWNDLCSVYLVRLFIL
jgi:valyl-tRNA synthetase